MAIRLKHLRPLWLVVRVFLTALFIASISSAQTAATGVVSGRVYNPATGQYVRNAEVRLQGSSRVVTTAGDGSFTIPNVPAGPANIQVSYIGYDTAAKTFFSAWMDVNFTGLIVARGDYDAAAGRYTFVGETPDFDHPGVNIPLREVLTRQDDDHFTYAYYETRDGREAQAVRLEYTRAR